ncbi:MarR family winged helix-turn-helix transcriptional regulator [Phenylobacterium sp.]|uniref:MarR family winged helix-turn-helix transcriptional regulator n=1 Tax=Phenylobacterium sp. TaxID=1871053 RepID=UPI0027363F09|nr:MarR family winged helix-turn-helix transcriptional regulator [Phenylobacterium sp.]MDP3855374.1 MarR family winged helix-turn-helix transcriptional regulator [Phenylobacterium sp.]
MTATPTVPFETTLQVRDTCLCLHAQRAARALARRFDEALRPSGLTNGQFSLLMALNGPQPMPMGRIAALLGADRTTLTAALKPLVRQALAEISSDPEDSRIRRVALTADGRARLAGALPLWVATHAALEAELEDSERLRRDLLSLSAFPSPSPETTP